VPEIPVINSCVNKAHEYLYSSATCTSEHADDMVVFLTSVVGVEIDDRILFQREHQQRRNPDK